jgi:hypothetical protein
MSVFSFIETILYGASVLVAASYGLTVVCIVVSCFQVLSLVLAYIVLLHTTAGLPRTQIFRDLGPALLASVPLLVVAAAIRQALATEVPVVVVLMAAGAAGGAAYLLALRAVSREAWSDVVILLQRVLPGLPGLRARIPTWVRARKTSTASSMPSRAAVLAEPQE